MRCYIEAPSITYVKLQEKKRGRKGRRGRSEGERQREKEGGRKEVREGE